MVAEFSVRETYQTRIEFSWLVVQQCLELVRHQMNTTIPGYLQQSFGVKTDFEFDIEVINSGIQGADSNTELNLIEQKLVTLFTRFGNNL